MKIEIMVFKSSGKYYSDCIAENEIDIPLWDDKFKKFIYDNLPCKMKGSFIVVRDIGEDEQTFHLCHYSYNDLLDDLYRFGVI